MRAGDPLGSRLGPFALELFVLAGTAADLPIHVHTSGGEEKTSARVVGSLNETLDTVERGLILTALKESGGIQTRAAEKLGISERVLRYKLKKYKIKDQ